MKKAFDQNVSRAKPRLRLGAMAGLLDTVEQVEEVSEPVMETAPAPAAPDLSSELRARLERARAPKPSAAEAMEAALRAPVAFRRVDPVAHPDSPYLHEVRAREEAPVADEGAFESFEMPLPSPQAFRAAPEPEVEVQTPPSPAPVEASMDPQARRERLKERLKAVRENPRPEPLPATVVETGTRAVERIASLQAELTRTKVLNLALTQDLEAARRQSEKATEEARLRMDEARRLTSEMEGRVKLLSDLERELAALEGERDEALLSLQESRQALQGAAEEKERLEAEVAQEKQALADSLSEEERIADELEKAQGEVGGLRRLLQTVEGERDLLSHQVQALTHERTELLDARKALEAVHRALSHAVAR